MRIPLRTNDATARACARARVGPQIGMCHQVLVTSAKGGARLVPALGRWSGSPGWLVSDPQHALALSNSLTNERLAARKAGGRGTLKEFSDEPVTVHGPDAAKLPSDFEGTPQRGYRRSDDTQSGRWDAQQPKRGATRTTDDRHERHRQRDAASLWDKAAEGFFRLVPRGERPRPTAGAARGDARSLLAKEVE
jgi:hypothetical protein